MDDTESPTSTGSTASGIVGGIVGGIIIGAPFVVGLLLPRPYLAAWIGGTATWAACEIAREELKKWQTRKNQALAWQRIIERVNEIHTDTQP